MVPEVVRGCSSLRIYNFVATDRDYGIIFLRFWWDATGRRELQLETFQGAISYYERQAPSFLPTLGKNGRSIEQNKVKSAMVEVAKKYGVEYPHYSVFYDALAKHAASISVIDVKKAAEGTLAGIQSFALFGVSIWVVAIGLGLFFMLNKRSSHS